MAPPRTFDFDVLKQLLKDHPDWTYTQLAEELTRDNRSTGPGDPRHNLVVVPHIVAATVSRLRPKWEAEGIPMPTKRRSSELVATLVRNTGVTIPDALQDQIELRRLRQLDRIKARLPVGGHDGEAGRARAFEQELRRERLVLDLHPDGTVFRRAAAPWEIDDHNQLISIVAAYRPPGYDTPMRPAKTSAP